jgi:hypothetical protein
MAKEPERTTLYGGIPDEDWWPRLPFRELRSKSELWERVQDLEGRVDYLYKVIERLVNAG